MKNGTPKEQLIRETFEKCLSGMDTLPSQRQEINLKMKDESAEKEPIRFRIPVIFAALVILLCVGVVSLRGRSGQLRPTRPENQYTAQPIETALSEGTAQESGENGAAAGTEQKKAELVAVMEEEGSVLICSAEQGKQLAESDEEKKPEFCGYLTYRVLEDGTAELGVPEYLPGLKKPLEKKLEIPGAVGEYTVTSIGLDTFSHWNVMTALTLPDSVTTIDGYAFAELPGLRQVHFPAELKTIGYMAFVGCVELTAVELPEGLTSIGSGAFSGCKSLKTVTLPDSVIYLGDNAFSGCTGLEEAVLSKGINVIDKETFSSCTSLARIDIPDSVTAIENRAFRGCESLKAVGLSENLESVGSGAFNGCSGLTSVLIPGKVTVIDNGAFNNCTGLTEVTLPEGLEKIGDNVFANCVGLSEINLPDSLASIGRNAFKGCDNLTCTVSDGSYAMKYCEENGIRCVVR